MCRYVYLPGEEMRAKNTWYLNGMDKDCDLRKLLWELLQKCLGMTSPNGELTWNVWTVYVSKRPFINKFKEDKRKERVFTASVLADFIFLCIKRDKYYNVEEYLNKAVNIIRSSKYALDLEEYKEDFKLKCKSDDKILECFNTIKSNSGFTENCKNCTSAWIYRNLQKIENDYESIISHKNVLLEYPSEEQSALVEEIYDAIEQYENGSLGELYAFDVLFPLINKCIQSYSIPDVADEKLAYIKWYTAHLCNWPFLKASLFYVNYYNEFSIYQMLHSASNILNVIKSENEELLSYIESERIVSYLTIGYTMPFILFFCGNPNDIETSCHMALQRIKIPQHRLRIYIALWNLHFQLGLDDLPEYNEYINKEFLENKAITEDFLLLKLEYQLYQYLYIPGYREIMKQSFYWMINEFYRDTGISETYDIIAELFFQNDKLIYVNENWFDNPTILKVAIKGQKSLDSSNFVIPQSPKKYHRVFSEYKLSNYLEDRRKSIMTHYSLWEQ